jgi:hypothetical protein
MSEQRDIPHGALGRVVSPAGPYRVGDVVSLAYLEPHVARIIPHEPRPEFVARAVVPEVMSVVVLRASAAFAPGDEVIASFSDPEFARLHLLGSRTVARDSAPPVVEVSAVATDLVARAPLVPEPSTEATDDELATSPVVLIGNWTERRRRQALSVIDKLFTIEKLGWYRHAFVVRLLVADDLVARAPVVAAIAEAFADFRSGASEALGGPLLESYVPGFVVDAPWLERLSGYAVLDARRRLAEAWSQTFEGDLGTTIESSAAALIATDASDPRLIDALRDYKASTFDAFERVAGAPDAVRFGTMTEPNVVLDDRLWKLASALFDSLQTSAA